MNWKIIKLVNISIFKKYLPSPTLDSGEAVEYFFASDASAIIEHTNRVIFLEDDDVAAVRSVTVVKYFTSEFQR